MPPQAKILRPSLARVAGHQLERGQQRRRPAVPDRQRARHGALPDQDVGHAQHLVEELGDDAAVHAGRRALVLVAEGDAAPDLALAVLARPPPTRRPAGRWGWRSRSSGWSGSSPGDARPGSAGSAGPLLGGGPPPRAGRPAPPARPPPPRSPRRSSGCPTATRADPPHRGRQPVERRRRPTSRRRGRRRPGSPRPAAGRAAAPSPLTCGCSWAGASRRRPSGPRWRRCWRRRASRSRARGRARRPRTCPRSRARSA